MDKVYLGFDPGLDGAIGAVDTEGRFVGVWDFPTVKISVLKNKRTENGTKKVTASRRNYDLGSLCEDTLLPIRNNYDIIGSALEKVRAMPGQGVASMFSIGRGVGILEGMLTGLFIPYEEVEPQTWKAFMLKGQGRDKEAARLKAQHLFPNAELHQKGHHGRAEALLLALFMQRTRGGNR